ncbi:hypothetical protein N7517_003690 [Penicillium concentricum]|uniref:Uncharacterized protein n=1 Tax=Penicillium concentricum TaxID=293559 RepID=A0A9W9S664_9EURO|nr:uncharacterized protein N7517_003690 [Penicillium concentricum]KAJ5371684.1 hypothetical protein N7517_003690 [Penicillium concentricum]
MANQMPVRLPKWLKKLEGKSNWSTWRKGLHEAFMAVDPVSWDVIMDRLSDTIIKQEPTTTRGAESVDLLFVEQDDSRNIDKEYSGTNVDLHSDLDSETDSDPETDDEPVITVTRPVAQSVRRNAHPPALNKHNPRDRRKLNIRARDLLASGLGREPLAEIERVMDAHEAYVKLESLYGKTSAQSVHIAWKKFSRVRYSTRGLTPAAFVDRFQKSLRDVKDQCVEVPPTVELAQFQQAIKPNPNSTKFMADMKVDIYDQNFMDEVYAEFLKDQAPI